MLCLQSDLLCPYNTHGRVATSFNFYCVFHSEYFVFPMLQCIVSLSLSHTHMDENFDTQRLVSNEKLKLSRLRRYFLAVGNIFSLVAWCDLVHQQTTLLNKDNKHSAADGSTGDLCTVRIKRTNLRQKIKGVYNCQFKQSLSLPQHIRYVICDLERFYKRKPNLCMSYACSLIYLLLKRVQ